MCDAVSKVLDQENKISMSWCLVSCYQDYVSMIVFEIFYPNEVTKNLEIIYSISLSNIS